MNIPNVPSADLNPNAQKEQQGRFQSWKDFLTKQKVIRCITGKASIKELINKLDPHELIDNRDIGIIVEFPKSIQHLHDFNNKLPAATAYVIFYQTGKTAVIGIGNYDVDFAKAWNIIVTRTTGTNLLLAIPNPPNDSVMLGIELEKAVESSNKILENLNKSVDKFNTIPGVEAEIYDGDSPDKVLRVNYQSNIQYLLHPTEANSGDALVYIYMDGFFEFSLMGNEEESCVHNLWAKEMEETPDDKKNLQWLYNNLLKLHTQYTKVGSELITDSHT